MTTRQFSIFLGASVCMHVLALALLFSPLLRALTFSPVRLHKRATIQLTLAPPLQAASTRTIQSREVIDSSQSIPTNVPPKNSPFESDRNTAASSAQAGKGNTALPNMQGVQNNQLHLQNSQASIAQKPEVSSPPVPTPPEKESMPQEKKPSQAVQINQRASPILETDSPPTQKVVEQDEPVKRAEPVQPARSGFSADRHASNIQGGAPIGPGPSVASQETELGRYKTKFYRAVGSRWYLYVDKQRGLLDISQVRVKCFIRSSGVIEPPQVIEGNKTSTLANISVQAIADVQALEPFSDALKEQLGNGYWEEVTFSVY